MSCPFIDNTYSCSGKLLEREIRAVRPGGRRGSPLPPPHPRELGWELAGGNGFESPSLGFQTFIKSLLCVGSWQPK